jgi:alanine dehydrogenase
MLGGHVTTVMSNRANVEEEALDADLVIGTVLIPGALAPKLLSRSLVRAMRRGAALVDISIDQGGCFETSKPTTYAKPTYEVDGVTHFCVTNMPGAVPKTSSEAICAAILPYVQKLASDKQWRTSEPLKKGINVEGGKIVHPALK